MSDSKINVNSSAKKNEEKIQYIMRSPHDSDHPYLMVSKAVIRDKNLSIETRGIFIYLLALPDDWKVQPKQIAKELGIGKNKVYKAIEKLIEQRYAKRVTENNGNLKGSTNLYFSEKKFPISQESGYRDSGSRKRDTTEERDIHNNEPKETPLPSLPTEEKKTEKKAAIAAVDVLVSEEVRDLAKKIVELLATHEETYVPASTEPIAMQMALLMKSGKVKSNQILDVINHTANDPYWCTILYKDRNLSAFCKKFTALSKKSKTKAPDTNKVDRRTYTQDGKPMEVEELY